jgi:chitinase
MSYDFHNQYFDSNLGHNAPLFGRSEEQGNQTYLNVHFATNYWLSNGTPKEKLILGLSTYGRSFKLVDSARTSIGSPSTSDVSPGPVI